MSKSNSGVEAAEKSNSSGTPDFTGEITVATGSNFTMFQKVPHWLGKPRGKKGKAAKDMPS